MKHFLFSVIFFFPTFLFASEPCTLIRVIDGDTLVVEYKGEETRIRISAIDAPETRQEYGPEATSYMRELLKDKPVTLDVHAIDFYGRTLATVYANGKDVGLQMVKAGAAWPYKNSGTPEYLLSFQEARVKHLGVWGSPNPVPPWEFRKKAKQ